MTVDTEFLNEHLPILKDLIPLEEQQSIKETALKALMEALNAEFYQYVPSPKDYSGTGGFIPKGKGESILFLPLDMYDTLGENGEHKLSQYFGVRVKYVSEPVQL